MPLSYFWNWRGNPAEAMLKERIEVSAAATLMLYRKKSKWRKPIHEFKYLGDRSCGRFLASMLAKKISESGNFSNIDIVIPVPLHPIKRWKRGFNQASFIANIIAMELGKPVIEGLLIRKRYSSTQTKKDKKGRKKGVEGVFYLKNPQIISNKRIMLVDDVLTTGATLEACAQELYRSGGVELSVVTLAFVE